MNFDILLYTLYISINLIVCVIVGRSLHRDGRYFILANLKDETITDAVNNLLLLGFYLLNFAYILFVLKTKTPIVTGIELIEMLSIKIGFIILVLAIIHYFNLAVITFFHSK